MAKARVVNGLGEHLGEVHIPHPRSYKIYAHYAHLQIAHEIKTISDRRAAEFYCSEKNRSSASGVFCWYEPVEDADEG